MIDLFEIVDNELIVSTHALMIEPFKSMWANDRSSNKEDVKRDFMYVELVCSPKKSNIFYQYADDERAKRVKKEVYGDENYQISMETMNAVMTYRAGIEETLAVGMLDAALTQAHKQKDFLKEYDPGTKTPTGALMMKPKEVLMALQQIDPVIASLEAAREKVHAGLTAKSRNRRDRETNFYEE